MTIRTCLLTLTGCAVLFSMAVSMTHSADKSHKLTSVSIRKMADSLHSVIAADRQAYSEIIVQRLSLVENRIPAAQNWKERHALPIHAQLLRQAAQDIQKKGAEFSYTLRSLWPINESHGPQTQVEQNGLEFVVKNPGQNFYLEEELGGRSYFTAIYADRATLPSCVECHNQHPQSPRRNFQQSDVMGAIVVRIPLEF